MDRLTAECFFNSIRYAIYQATQRRLAKEELVELSKTLQLVIDGIPGDATVNEKARAFCISVYASGLFNGKVDPEALQTLLGGAEALQNLLQFTFQRRPNAKRLFGVTEILSISAGPPSKAELTENPLRREGHAS